MEERIMEKLPGDLEDFFQTNPEVENLSIYKLLKISQFIFRKEIGPYPVKNILSSDLWQQP